MGCMKCALENGFYDSPHSWYWFESNQPDFQVDGLHPYRVEFVMPDDSDVFGEYPSGYLGKMWMTFRVDTVDGPKFYRKYGSVSSYGDGHWDGRFEEVFQAEQTVTVFTNRKEF